MTEPDVPAPPPPRYARTPRLLRKVVILVVGGTITLLGVVLLFTPGPAVLVIPAGIAILATEFVWAKRLADRSKAWARSARDRALKPRK